MVCKKEANYEFYVRFWVGRVVVEPNLPLFSLCFLETRMNIVFLCWNDNCYLPYFDIVGNVEIEEGNALYLPHFNFYKA